MIVTEQSLRGLPKWHHLACIFKENNMKNFRQFWLVGSLVLAWLGFMSLPQMTLRLNAAFPGTNGLIAFGSNRDGNEDIYSMNADGSRVTRLTNNPAVDSYPSWSADGAQIVFNSDRDGNYEIYKMNADGSGQIRLTNNSAIDANASWSPDGTKI